MDKAVPIPLPGEVAATVVTATDIVVELAVATGFLVIIIGLHGWFLSIASKNFSTRFAVLTPQTAGWRINALMSGTVAALVAIHLIETLIWTAPIYALDAIRNFRDAYSFVLQAYTTLGDSSVDLGRQYRLIGPVIAMSGLFTFGWTGSALVYVMSQILRLEARRARLRAFGKAASMSDVRGPFGA